VADITYLPTTMIPPPPPHPRYHSHVSEVGDTNAGLVGPILITRRGSAKSADDPTPTGIDREFVLLFQALDEGHSSMTEANMYKYELVT
jgi:hypothetical protein